LYFKAKYWQLARNDSRAINDAAGRFANFNAIGIDTALQRSAGAAALVVARACFCRRTGCAEYERGDENDKENSKDFTHSLTSFHVKLDESS